MSNTDAICINAARIGDLECLKYQRTRDPGHAYTIHVTNEAAENGHLEVLQWLRSHNPPAYWNTWTCACAARGGHLNVLQWLRSRTPPCPWDGQTCHAAAVGNHIVTFIWLRSQVPPCPFSHLLGHTVQNLSSAYGIRMLTWIVCRDQIIVPKRVGGAYWYNDIVSPLYSLLVTELLEDIYVGIIDIPKDVIRMIGAYADVSEILFDHKARLNTLTALGDCHIRHLRSPMLIDYLFKATSLLS